MLDEVEPVERYERDDEETCHPRWYDTSSGEDHAENRPEERGAVPARVRPVGRRERAEYDEHEARKHVDDFDVEESLEHHHAFVGVSRRGAEAQRVMALSAPLHLCARCLFLTRAPPAPPGRGARDG